MRFMSALAVGLALLSASASAQTADSVMAHYRAYNAAVERDDLAAAKTEAEAALAAAESANDPRTAVLAFNLALAHVWTDDFAGAIAPAQRALDLARGGAQGVDPTFATMIIGRAELATAGAPGAERLQRVFADGDLANVPADEINPAAAQLGVWALAQARYDMARDAWAVAGQHADGSPLGQPLGLATARTWQAGAIVSSEFAGRQRRMNLANAREAYGMLNEAVRILRPMALESRSAELTLPQRVYAQAWAWRGVIRAKLINDRQQPFEESPAESNGVIEVGAPDRSIPRCAVTWDMPDEQLYPTRYVGQLAAVVLQLDFDDSGAVSNTGVVAQLGLAGFAAEMQQYARGIRLVRAADAPAGCRMARSLLWPGVFTYTIDIRTAPG